LLSVTNIILGFGLAIYFGRVRAPWAAGQENEEKSDAEIANASEEDASDETPEVSAEQEVLDSVETIREELQEQPELQAVNETS
jgi:hypothetical protein